MIFAANTFFSDAPHFRDRISTPEERDAAKRIITSNAALGGLSGEAARRAFLTRAGFG